MDYSNEGFKEGDQMKIDRLIGIPSLAVWVMFLPERKVPAGMDV